MSKSLTDLTIDDFTNLIGENFNIGEYVLKLSEVRENSETPSRFRKPFSLSFEAPENCSLQSEVLCVKHNQIGQHDLLVTQVSVWETPTIIEICFN
jgi:hypothetical protein